MAAISLADCTVRWRLEGEFQEFLVITPATADGADTIDLSSAIAGRTAALESVWNETDSSAVSSSTLSSVGSLTLGGSATNKVYRARVSVR